MGEGFRLYIYIFLPPFLILSSGCYFTHSRPKINITCKKKTFCQSYIYQSQLFITSSTTTTNHQSPPLPFPHWFHSKNTGNTAQITEKGINHFHFLIPQALSVPLPNIPFRKKKDAIKFEQAQNVASFPIPSLWFVELITIYVMGLC